MATEVRRALIFLGCGVLLLLATTGLRLDAILGFVPADTARLLIPLVIFAAGAAGQLWLGTAPRRDVRRRRLRRRAGLLIAALLALWCLHWGWVEHRPSWSRALVVGLALSPDCPCLPAADDRVCSQAPTRNARCIECANFLPRVLESCWNPFEVLIVKAALALAYLVFAGGFGAAAGLLVVREPPVRVFVSYRRDDSEGLVKGPLAEFLVKEFGADNVFLDVRSIGAGEKWEAKIRAHVELCHLFLVVIGPEWSRELRERQDKGAIDWVRREVEIALRSEALCVPLVFGGAGVPDTSELPEGLAGLARFQAVTLGEDVVGPGPGFAVLDRERFGRALEPLETIVEKVRARAAG